MQKYTLALILFCNFSICQAQINYGVKLSAGMSFIQNPKAELAKAEYYNFDIEPYQYAHDVAAFVQCSYKKMTFKGSVGYWKANFTTYSNVKPFDVDDGGWLTYPPQLYPVYFKIDRRVIYPYVGLGFQYRFKPKWAIGLDYNYLFSNKGYMITPIEDFVTNPEVLGNPFNKNWVKAGYFDYQQRVSNINLNVNYQVSSRLGLLLEYQRNINSMSTTQDYYFDIFNIGLNFTIRPTKPYIKDEITVY